MYKHIIVDEGQDLSPIMLKSLVKAIPEDGTFTFLVMLHNKFMDHDCRGEKLD